MLNVRHRGLLGEGQAAQSRPVAAAADLVSRAWSYIPAEHRGRFLRFLAVGISGVLLNSAILYALVTVWGFNHLVAAAIASEVSILSNFALNDLWTFRDTQPGSSWVRRGAQYNAVALSGMVISLAVLALLTMAVGLHYLIANVIAIGAATLSNYLLNSHFTWACLGPRPVPAASS